MSGFLLQGKPSQSAEIQCLLSRFHGALKHLFKVLSALNQQNILSEVVSYIKPWAAYLCAWTETLPESFSKERLYRLSKILVLSVWPVKSQLQAL